MDTTQQPVAPANLRRIQGYLFGSDGDICIKTNEQHHTQHEEGMWGRGKETTTDRQRQRQFKTQWDFKATDHLQCGHLCGLLELHWPPSPLAAPPLRRERKILSHQAVSEMATTHKTKQTQITQNDYHSQNEEKQQPPIEWTEMATTHRTKRSKKTNKKRPPVTEQREITTMHRTKK